MSVFVIGCEGKFSVGVEVIVQPGSTAREAFSNRVVKLAPVFRLRRVDGGVTSSAATMKRGVAEEVDGYYARVLPPDAEVGLADLDARIAARRAELDAMHAERQAFLAANVVRGERIAKRHASSVGKDGVGHCGRCGDRKKLAAFGPYQRMLCEDCVAEKAHDEAVERHPRGGGLLGATARGLVADHARADAVKQARGGR